MKLQAVKERSRRYKNDFFADWVEGRVNSEQELMNRGRNYGLTAQSVFQCIVCKNDSQQAGAKQPIITDERLQAERDHLYFHLKRAFMPAGLPFILFNKNDMFVFVLTAAESTYEFEKKLLRHLEDVQNELLQSLKCSFSFGVGKPSERSMELPTVFKEALEALQAGYAANESCFIRTYRAKDMLDLLRRIPMPDLEAFYSDTFQQLLAAEEKDRHDLMQTLRIYVENEGQIAETAKRLFLHRNTVIYRLDKCEKLTRRNLKDPSDTIRIRLAFHMEPLLS
jgi:purine catabolism regulator